MAVGEEHGVDVAYVVAQGLGAQVWRGVDENGVLEVLDEDRAAQALVASIRRSAHSAFATDAGDAHRGPGAEEGDLQGSRGLPGQAGTPTAG